MDWFLYDNGLRHERVKYQFQESQYLYSRIPYKAYRIRQHCLTILKKENILQEHFS